MTEPGQIINLLEHNLEILEKDLQRPPSRPTAHQRVQNCVALIKMLKNKESD